MNFKQCLKMVIDPDLRREIHRKLLSVLGPHEETLLHYLVVENNIDAVHWLIANGADCDTVNRFGSTPLMDAVVLGEEEMVALLLRMGASPNFRNDYGDTALHKAYESGSPKSIKMLLLNHGAREDVRNNIGEYPSESA